jgi:hypothetical protein
MAQARSAADLVVTLVQVAVLAHHKKWGHHAGKDSKVTAKVSHVRALQIFAVRIKAQCWMPARLVMLTPGFGLS